MGLLRHLLSTGFARLITAASEGTYARLFNLRSMLLGRSVRIRWDGEHYVAQDESPVREWRFPSEAQGDLAYRRGLSHRATTLGEQYFLDDIPFRPGDRVIDCGANVGDLHLWFLLNGLDVDYVGFEPAPLEFECLKLNVAPADAHEVGLWNSDGVMEFFVSSQGADSSIIRPPEFTDVVQVEVHRLSNYVHGPVRLLKLEAEGAEPEVLEGLGQALSYVDFISADLGPERGLNQESTLPEVTNLLAGSGFEVRRVDSTRLTVLFGRKGRAGSGTDPTGR